MHWELAQKSKKKCNIYLCEFQGNYLHGNYFSDLRNVWTESDYQEGDAAAVSTFQQFFGRQLQAKVAPD